MLSTGDRMGPPWVCNVPGCVEIPVLQESFYLVCEHLSSSSKTLTFFVPFRKPSPASGFVVIAPFTCRDDDLPSEPVGDLLRLGADLSGSDEFANGIIDRRWWVLPLIRGS